MFKGEEFLLIISVFLESPFIGTWTLISSENANAYLRELGMSLAKRKTEIKVAPQLIISKNGDTWCISIGNTLKRL